MNEDEKFFYSLKTKLERGTTVSSKALLEIKAFAQVEAQKRRMAKFYRRVFAVAASLVIICALAVSFVSYPIHDQDIQIVCTIELFDDSQELSSSGGMDTVEMLLAWQDAPYQSIENELISL